MSKMAILQQQILLRSRQPKRTTHKSRLTRTVVPAPLRRRACRNRAPPRMLSSTSHMLRPQDPVIFSADGRSTVQRGKSIRQGQKSLYTDITTRPGLLTRYTRTGRRTHPAVCGYTQVTDGQKACHGFTQAADGRRVFRGCALTVFGNEVDKTWNRQCRQCGWLLTCWTR